MKGSVKIIFWIIGFALGAILIVYGTDIWRVIKKQFTQVQINEEIRVKGPMGPPYVKGPMGPPPE